MIEPKHADLQNARSRALGVLTGILIALSVFSLLWYMFVPRADGVYDETNMRETATYQTPIERLQGAVQDASESTSQEGANAGAPSASSASAGSSGSAEASN